MNRREMLKCAASLSPALILGLPEGTDVAGYMQNKRPAESGNQECDAPFDVDAELRKAYDPVAVLEAMRERGFSFGLTYGSGLPKDKAWSADFWAPTVIARFPDFASAVRWLHEQAAAANAEFAKAWPVPEWAMS